MLYKNTTNYLCSERHPRGLRLDHVLTPLKSELDFHKLLIANDLTKCDSSKLSFSGEQGNNISVGKMRERMDW